MHLRHFLYISAMQACLQGIPFFKTWPAILVRGLDNSPGLHVNNTRYAHSNGGKPFALYSMSHLFYGIKYLFKCRIFSFLNTCCHLCPEEEFTSGRDCPNLKVCASYIYTYYIFQQCLPFAIS